MHSSVPAAVALAVLGAALLHATWNALAKSVPDHLVGFVVLDLATGALALAGTPFVDFPARGAWPYIGVSLVLHTAYQAFLLTGYRLGDLNQVYPIARGTAPLVVAVVAVPAAGERLGAAAIVGLLAVAGGLIGLAGIHRAATAEDAARQRRAVAFAFATGLVIAGYSVVDGLGVRRSGGPIGYALWVMVADALPLPLYALARHRDRVRAAWRLTWRPTALGGAMALVAYGIVLWAQTRGALAAVAALRETSVVAAAIIGARVFGESLGRRRVVAATVVTPGVVLLNVA
jgi:drug/metabolite transporter (DMT)-like permease